MPLEPRSQRGASSVHSLDLPPPFRLVMLREAGDAFAHACTNAVALGAGALVFVGRFDLAEFAVVLEPDEPLDSARLAFYAGMVALVDALAALAPPNKPITIDWPGTVRIDRGIVGGARLAWPIEADERAIPDWLVFGASIRTAATSTARSGPHPFATALQEVGFDEAGSERLVERFARHLMAAIDRWREAGFAVIAEDYCARLACENGTQVAIDEKGDLHRRRGGEHLECRQFSPALMTASWLDPETGAPRL